MPHTITEISIQNFQAHKNLKLKFGEHITSITGPSDRGKSAILRALIWVITNRPSGDSFIRYGEEECQVTVRVDDHTVERIKGKKRNLYVVDGVEFKAIKSDVPIEVQRIFNVDCNNIQSQFDPVFWFSETAGEVAKNLNRIVNLDIIDYVLGNLQSTSKKVQTEVDVLDRMIADQENALAQESQIEQINKVINRIDAFNEQNSSIQNRLKGFENLILNIGSLNCWMNKAEKWHGTYLRLSELMNAYVDSDKKFSILKNRILEIKELESIISSGSVPEEIFQKIKKVENWSSEKQKNQVECRNLEDLIVNAEEISSQIEKFSAQHKALEDKLHKILYGQICPLCGRGETYR